MSVPIEDQSPLASVGLEDLICHCDEDNEFLIDEWIENSAGAEVIDNCGEVFVDVNCGNFDFELCGVLEVKYNMYFIIKYCNLNTS